MMDAFHTMFNTGAEHQVMELCEDRMYVVYGVMSLQLAAAVRIYKRKKFIMPEV